MRVRRGDETYTLRPSRNYYSTTDPSKGAISRFFEGEATSEVDVRWGLRRDFWLAVRPDLVSLEQPIARADRKFADSPGQVQAIVIQALTELYRRGPAAGGVPGDRVPAGHLDLDRRGDRGLRGAPGAPGPRRRPGCAASDRSTRPASAASSHEPDVEHQIRAKSDSWNTLARLILAAWLLLVVARPLRGPRTERRQEQSRIEELQAAKEAKYREIRDAELDREMGKLSQEDWRSVDRDLRGEAIEILRQLDRLEGRRRRA